MKPFLSLRFASLVPALVLLATHALGAQAPDSVVQIPPLTVEVLRSSLAGARTPFAVSGLDGVALRQGRTGVFLSDALVAIPGLQIQNRYNFAVGERVAVRGFGARAQFGIRGLRVLVDGIPATLPDGQSTLDHLDPALLGRVQLLRGPGSALYGNGAGGVLLLETRHPAPGGPRLTARGVGGSAGLVEGGLVVEDGHPDGSGTLASLSRMDYDGFRSDPVNGGTYGAASRWTLDAHHRRALAGGRLDVSVAGVDLDAENPGSLPLDSLGDPDRSAWGFNVRQGAGKTVRQGQVGVAWKGPLATLDGEVAGWGIRRDLRNPIPSDIVGVDRLAGGARVALAERRGRFQWGAGVDMEAMRDDRTNHENDGGTEGALTLDQRENVRALGVHAHLGGDVGPVSLQAALRHDRVRFAVDDHYTASDPDDSGARTLTAWSPSLGALVPLGAQAALFASTSSFLETPTTTELANRPDGAGGFNAQLEPTRGWTLEGGLRGEAGGWLGWELVGFRTTLRDELVPFEVPQAPGRTFYRNAGRSRHQGVEATLRAVLPGGFSARAAYTKVDARFRSAAGDAEPGDRLPGRSPNRIEADARFERGRWFAGADLVWSDAMPVDDANTTEAPAYTVVGLRVGADGIPLGALGVSPFVALDNLFGESWVASVVPNAFGGRFFEPGPGRQLRMGLSLTVDRGG